MKYRPHKNKAVVLLSLVVCTIYVCWRRSAVQGSVDGSVAPMEIVPASHPAISNLNSISNTSPHQLDSTLFTLNYSLEGLDGNQDVTIVTAYFNIGTFQKGNGGSYFTPNLYHTWMKIFAKIHNPVIVYLDNSADVRYFTSLRENVPSNLTQIIHLSKEDTWAFKLRDSISKIYSRSDYPKHSPNTVVPEYSCAMHAKYECMLISLINNPFKTKYFAWLDIGYFRVISQKNIKAFTLGLPPGFDENKVAYSQVNPALDSKTTASNVFYSNIVWVSGGYFVARADVMVTWVHDYIRATEYYLSQGLMNTDQQIILAMHVDKSFTHEASVQVYRSKREYNPWFYLGYISKEYGVVIDRLY